MVIVVIHQRDIMRVAEQGSWVSKQQINKSPIVYLFSTINSSISINNFQLSFHYLISIAISSRSIHLLLLDAYLV